MLKRRALFLLVVIGAVCFWNFIRVLLDSTSYDGGYTRLVQKSEKATTVGIGKPRRQKFKRYFTTSASKIFIRKMGYKYEKSYPKVLGIGVKKCGTTALFRFLSLHPNIVLPDKPELHFFDTDAYLKGPKYYRNLLPYTAPHELAVEKSPRYFVLKNVPPRVKGLVPNVKLLLVVCDPIKRAYSDFNFESHRKTKTLLKVQKNMPFYSGFDDFVRVVMDKVRKQKELSTIGFEDIVLNSWSPNRYYLTIPYTGLYSIYLKHWLKYFPREQIHVINGEELITNPVKVVKETQNFLGLDVKVDERDIVFDKEKGYHCIKKYRRDDLVQCMGEAKGTTRNKTISQMMSKGTLSTLKSFYDQYNDELFHILGKKFDWT